MSAAMVLVFDASGVGRGLYGEMVDLSAIGRLSIERATSIEFDGEAQLWRVHALDGRRLHQSPSRQACLDWERDHFNRLPQLNESEHSHA